MAGRKYRRDQTEVSCCLKYLIFGFNVIFWLLGLGILAIGVWAWTEKDTFNNLSRLTNIYLDPAFIFIIAGSITFIIGFTGCVGALRENTCLLALIKLKATGGFQTFIVHYRDDPDQQNLIDWIQEDWEIIKNKQCGYDVRKPDYLGDRSVLLFEKGCLRAGEQWVESNLVPVVAGLVGIAVLQKYDAAKIIFDKGCLQAGEEWLEQNLLLVGGVVIFVAFLQILGICFAQNLRADIFAQKAKWHC